MSAATRIAWDTAPAQSGDRLRIRVYDIAGRCVRTLVDGRSTVGAHQLSWDGRDDRGARLRPGIFHVRLEARGLDRTEPVVLLR
jgi:flagellar hook assembly protein FlgD